jgi:alpha-glucoside transport system permease protein
MTDLQERPARVAYKLEEKPPRRWITPVVWAVIVAAIAGIIYTGLSSNNGSKILYDSQKQHNWIVEAIFNPTSVGQKIFVMVFAIVLFLAVMGLILWAIDRPRVPNGVLVAGFLGPIIIALTGGLLFAAFKTIFESFRKFDQFGTDTGWNGFSNYSHFFNAANRDMLINTVLWVFVVPIAATTFGLVYATLVDRTRFEAAAKALIFLPTAISMVAASVIWKYVYYSPAPEGGKQIGLLNAIVTAFGGTPSNWTLSFPSGTVALIVVMIWIQAGFAMTVLSAAIKAVPDDIVEAARIDGATGMRLFRSITIPTIRPTLVVVITTVAIASLKTFDIVNVMGGNLPANNIIANNFYNNLVVQQNGLAGALAVLIFVIVSPIIVFNVIQMKKSEANR